MSQSQKDRQNIFITQRHFTAWQLIKSFWQSEQTVSAYFFFLAVMLMTIMLVGFDVIFNYWYNYFYNSLQAYNKTECIRLLIFFFILAGFYIVLAVYRFYVAQLFAWRWRRWLTKQFIGRWLHNRGYYYLESFDVKTDNPDQRIQEDVGALATNSIDLSMGLISAITTFFAFIYILWTLSGTLVLPLGPLGVFHIPGYLVWVGLIYAFFGTYYTFRLGQPLVALNFEQQRREASFRFAATDLRANAENVALYEGENHQKGVLDRLFGRVLDNWYLIILRQKLLLWFTSGYNQASVVLPLVVVLPNYFDRVFLLGGLIQSLQAFRSVQDSLSFIINSYTQIAQWQAVTQRLTTFANHINDIEEKAETVNQLKISDHSGKNIVAKTITVNTPKQEPLLINIAEVFEHGRNYLIKGQSGLGKSTFVKALAGIWPYASGEVIYPQNKKIMFLSQRPYMPIGTLEEAILFPDKETLPIVEHIKEVLQSCRLDHLIPRLDEVATWSEQLSPGEIQRVAFARVLLHRPDWVVLDESTSMLDLKNEKNLYQLLQSALPGCSIISVGHRPSLEEFHDEVIEMAEYAPGD